MEILEKLSGWDCRLGLLVPSYADWNIEALGKLNGSNFLLEQAAAVMPF
jgi:hypothetical protein